MEKLKVLIVDDEEIIRKEIGDFFCRKDLYHIFCADCPSKAYSILNENEIDIVILDINMPEENGLDVLKKIKTGYPDIEIIMITGLSDNEIINQATKLGAFDFFYKPIGLIDMQHTIERTGNFIKLKSRLNKMEKNYSVVSDILKMSEGDIIGESEGIKNVIDLAIKTARSRDTSVIITGPSGSGKELIARVLHYKSERNNQIFFPVNCSAIPDNLIESEFFGYKKGAFTNANEDRMGIFEMANSGTLFLDEIGDLSLNAQSKLLRTLEERKIRRIGDNKNISIDLRILAATNKNLYSMVKNNQFREDLLYRLNTVEIKLPSLKERKEDIPMLLKYYTDQYSVKIQRKRLDISEKVLNMLLDYDFPGNIRELKNIVERAVILCDKDKIDISHISIPDIQDKMDLNNISDIKPDGNLPTLELDKLERFAIIKALDKCKYNQKKAAELLNISVFALSRKISKYSIDSK